MSCVSSEDLVSYWADDLAPAEVDRIDEHLIGCATCSAESARVFTVAQGLRAFVPPVVTRSTIETLRTIGLRVAENAFAPGTKQPIVFRRDVDVLIHRLAGLDLSTTSTIALRVIAESTGDVLFAIPSVPFDASEGVLIACQHHYAQLPHDVLFEVRAIGSSTEQVAVYSIPHTFET